MTDARIADDVAPNVIYVTERQCWDWIARAAESERLSISEAMRIQAESCCNGCAFDGRGAADEIANAVFLLGLDRRHIDGPECAR